MGVDIGSDGGRPFLMQQITAHSVKNKGVTQ